MNILGKWSNSSQSPYFIETSTKDDVLSLSHIMNELSAWLNYYHYKCPFYAPCFQWDSIQAKWKNNCYSKQLCWFMDVVRSLLSTLPHMGRAYWAFDDIQVCGRAFLLQMHHIHIRFISKSKSGPGWFEQFRIVLFTLNEKNQMCCIWTIWTWLAVWT